MGWILLPNGVTVTLTTLTRSSLVRIQVRQPQKPLFGFSGKGFCFCFLFFLFPRLSAHNNLETTAAIGYNKHDKAKKPLRTAMRALRFHRRINGKQTKRQPDRHQVRNVGQTEEPL